MPSLTLAEWEEYATQVIVWDRLYERQRELHSSPPSPAVSVSAHVQASEASGCAPLPTAKPRTPALSNNKNLSGILAAENDQGDLTGLAIYHIIPDLAHGSALVTEHLLAFGLLNRSSVARELTQALETCARDHGCSAVYANTRGEMDKLLERSDWLDTLLTDSGYIPTANAYCKALPAS
ncbi:hypothetical protein ACTL6U_09895 [Rhodovibrionaceae bacterium A322]